MVRFSFFGHDWVGFPQGALFLPSRRALFLADLHLEKASWFARGGQMLPPYDSLATLTDVAVLQAHTGAEEIWCLGDSFHDREGCNRLPPSARELLVGLTAKTRWTWVIGNHDPYFEDDCGGRIVEEALVDGIFLRHQADPAESQPELSGHFHPKLRVSRRGCLISRRCFVGTDRKIILPAFGALTGGLDADHPEILRAAGGPAEALVPIGDRLLRFPLELPVLRTA